MWLVDFSNYSYILWKKYSPCVKCVYHQTHVRYKQKYSTTCWLFCIAEDLSSISFTFVLPSGLYYVYVVV